MQIPSIYPPFIYIATDMCICFGKATSCRSICWLGPGIWPLTPLIPTDLNVSTVKREIANCVLAAVYIPMELWGSFYHWVEWQNIACTQHTSCKTCKNFKCFTLNFWTIIVPKWTSSTLDDPNLIKLWNV